MISRSEILFTCRSEGELLDLRPISTKHKNAHSSVDKQARRVKTQLSVSAILPGSADMVSKQSHMRGA